MFWRRRDRGGRGAQPQEQIPDREPSPAASPDAVDAEGEEATPADEPRHEPPEVEEARPVEVERGAPRAAAISRVAEELDARGERVVELFEEVESPRGRAILPIHTRRRDGGDAFVEVETGPWDEDTVAGVIGTAAVLRASRYADAPFKVLGAYPVPPEVNFFAGTSPAALFQLDLVLGGAGSPEESAAAFVEAANRRWDVTLDYTPEGLPLVEDLLLAALSDGAGEDLRDGGPEDRAGGGPFVLDVLAHALGCYVGETLRNATRPLPSAWKDAAGETEDPIIEFESAIADPIGKARAFLESGAEDSIAYYVSYAVGELRPPEIETPRDDRGPTSEDS